MHRRTAGIVDVQSSCNVRVTKRQRLGDKLPPPVRKRYANGATVVTGQRLADYADKSGAQSACQLRQLDGAAIRDTVWPAARQVAIDQNEFLRLAHQCSHRDGGLRQQLHPQDPTRRHHRLRFTTLQPHQLGDAHATDRTPSSKICDLDIDGSGTVEPDRDGAPLLRHMPGMRQCADRRRRTRSHAPARSPPRSRAMTRHRDYDLDPQRRQRRPVHDLATIAQRAMRGGQQPSLQADLGHLLLNRQRRGTGLCGGPP